MVRSFLVAVHWKGSRSSHHREHVYDRRAIIPLQSKLISLDMIAEAIHQHVLLGSFDADHINSLLWPSSKITIAKNTPLGTPQDRSYSRTGSVVVASVTEVDTKCEPW